METVKMFALRQSCRSYTDEPISDIQLNAILKAGNASPVGMGRFENLKIIAIQKKDLLDEINRAAAAMFGKPDMRPTYDAPTLIVVCSKDGEGVANVACVVENMHLMATDMGLGSVYLAGVPAGIGKDEELMKKLHIPEGFAPLGALSVGHSAEPLKERELTIKKIETEIIR